MDDSLYTVKEAGDILKVGKNRVYGLIKAGILPAMKLGGFKIRKATLEEFMEKYEGYDLTDPNRIKLLEASEITDGF